MEAVQAEKEERKNQVLAGFISLGITGLILLFFILYKIITPNPPFEFAGEGGIEVNFGTYNEGTGEVESDGIGTATSVVAESSSSKSEASSSKEEVYTSDNGEPVDMKKDENKPKIENNVTVIKTNTTTPKENKNNNSLLNAYTKNTGKNGGGDGNSGEAGNEGQPDGNLNTHGIGGTGGGTDGSNGLGGRKLITLPCKADDSREEGTVVVIIKVDKQGNITAADPNGRGTNTSSAMLKSKARQAVLCAKLSPSDKEEQTLAITIVFKF